MAAEPFATESAERDALEEWVRTAPLDQLDVSDDRLFVHDLAPRALERIRQQEPVHFCPESASGSYWSITRYEDIRTVEMDFARFSSEGSIALADKPLGRSVSVQSFITMDPPKHDVQRRAVRPALSPSTCRQLEPLLRERVAALLDALPDGETFDWVDRIAIEVTTQMLATLFGMPLEDHRKLARWSDLTTGSTQTGERPTSSQRRDELMACLAYFRALWEERRSAAEGGPDLISLLSRTEGTKDMDSRPEELLGNLLLLIVGGNDTTRSSISGGVLALNRYPEEYAKLRANPELIPNMVSEMIRWQTPLAHMRRTATEDVTFRGKTIRAGDRVAMWYLSSNRDERLFPDGDRLRIDRKNASQHQAFGFGRHRCVGSHLAEMQLRVLWEEALRRFEFIEVVGRPVRVRSSFVRGFLSLPVRVHRR